VTLPGSPSTLPGAPLDLARRPLGEDDAGMKRQTLFVPAFLLMTAALGGAACDGEQKSAPHRLRERFAPAAASGQPAAATGDPQGAKMDPLKPGDAAPDITFNLQDGKAVKLSSLAGKQVLVYFYPKDDTPGCTIEAQGLRDGWAEIQGSGLEVYGVSTQDADSHKAFIDKQKLPSRSSSTPMLLWPRPSMCPFAARSPPVNRS
jgi:hypothetical protein